MKQVNGLTMTEIIAYNDLVLRRAAGSMSQVYVCVRTSDKKTFPIGAPRPMFFDMELIQSPVAPDSTYFTYLPVSIKDPYEVLLLDDKDHWVYRPTAVPPPISVPAAEPEAAAAAAVEAAVEEIVSVFVANVPDTKAKIIVRHSELVDAASCLKAYDYKWNKNLRPVRTDPKLVTGTLVHHYWSIYEPALTDGEDAAHGMALRGVEQEFHKYYNSLPENDGEGRAIATACLDLTMDICNGYHKWRPTTDLSPIQQAEATFNLKLGEFAGVEVVLSGTMDGIGVTVSHKIDDYENGDPYPESEVWLREYKTCKSILGKLKQYPLDKQTRRYVAALQAQGIPVAGVELVLASKSTPLPDEDFLLKESKGVRLISRDKDKWSRADTEQAHRVAKLGTFAEPDGKTGLTEAGFHGILMLLKDKPNPFFHLERLRFNDQELAVIVRETLIEAHRIHVTRETSTTIGDSVWTRNQGIMGMNCNYCSMRDLCTMELKGVDTSLMLQEHFVVDNSIHERKVDDDSDVGE